MTHTQRRALWVGFGLILAAAGLVVLVWAGSYLPGFAGELFSKLAGMMWTPILLDLTIFGMGLVLVLTLNAWIRAREGDELVYLEQVEDPEAPADLPPAARSAVFPERPEPRSLAPALAAIEGALDLPDPGEAASLLYELPVECLDRPEVLALRIRLARAQGRRKEAEELEARLRKAEESGE